MQIWYTIKHITLFGIKYIKYVYYGVKQRISALFNLQLSLFGFFKSLFKVPFESYRFTKMEMEYG